MPVAFDAVGPSSSGAGIGSSTALSWTHTVTSGVTSPAVLVGVNLDTGGSGMTMTVTCAGTGMTSLGAIDTNGNTTGFSNGYVQLFLATAGITVGGGGNAIAVTVTGGTPTCLVGGSLSFSGYTGYGTIGHVGTQAGNGSTAPVTVAATTSGNIVAGFLAAGATLACPATSRFLNNFEGASTPNDTGDAGGATTASTGSAVTLTFTTTSTSYAGIAVEMQGAAGTNTSPAYAASYDTTAVAGTGTWVNPADAEGTGTSPFATWTAP